MKILLDMNLSPRLIPILEQHGHICTHWSAVGDLEADDQTIMKWAAERGYVVLTHDLDFGAILAIGQHVAPSVIQIRTQDVLSESFQTLLVRMLDEFRETLETGALVVADKDRFRVRVLPLSRR
ncbi:DUF5615 family PIN-like protein [Candidatus Sumerlaeota bacterium]|nr:DUF5615 family PIN-like protein [Candidatus Sumerlaeota bacterium]